MDSPFEAVTKAVNEAETLNRVVDRQSAQLARLLKGRLRQCNSWDLADLKRELRDFDLRTTDWKRE